MASLNIINWRPKPDRHVYRVTVRKAGTLEKLGVIRDLCEPHCTLDTKWLTQGEVEVRIEAAAVASDGTNQAFSTWIPFYVPTPAKAAALEIRAPFPPDGLPIRLIVRGEGSNDILFDRARIDGCFTLPTNELRGATTLRCRFMTFDQATSRWVEQGSAQRVSLSGPSATTPFAGAWREPGKRALPAPFLFTVDVEVNVRYQRLPDLESAVTEHVFGITPGGGARAYGIGFIMDALEQRDMKGTFFVDVLMQYQVGEHQLRRVVDAIASRGHDVQLHLHPNPNLYYSTDVSVRELGLEYARKRSVDSFRRAFELAVGIFDKCVGRAPIAFRNGTYALTDGYFDVMKNFGIRFDSSLYAFKNAAVSPWMLTRSAPFVHASGVVELPVTWAILTSSQGTRVRQHTVHLGRDAERIDAAITKLWKESAAPCVMVAHSYTFLKDLRDLPTDDKAAWNARFKSTTSDFVYKHTYLDDNHRKLTMDGPNLARLETLRARLDLVAGTAGARAMTFADLGATEPGDLVHDLSTDPVVVVDDNQALRVTGLQRYGRSYLQHLDQHG